MTQTSQSDAKLCMPLGLAQIGPALLASLGGIELMCYAWKVLLARPVSPSELARFTPAGAELYRPDYDMPIYAAGMLLTLTLAIAFHWSWRRKVGPTVSAEASSAPQTLLWLHFPVAAGLALLPLLRSTDPRLTLVSGLLALGFCIGALVASRMRPSATFPCRQFWRPGPWTEALVVTAVVILFVWIPDKAHLPEWIWSVERFQHWNFFAMAPALAYRHGAALGTDAYAQYGVGWPLVLAWLSNWTPLSYEVTLKLTLVFSCVYYLAVYVLLRMLARSRLWAIAGLLLTLLVTLYTGIDLVAPKWRFPSSTPLRWPFDVFIFIAILHLLSGRRVLAGWLVGAGSALAILFCTDTGVNMAIMLGLLTTAIAVTRIDGSSALRSNQSLVWIWCGFVVTLAGGLVIASRGTCFQAAFFRGWLEAILNYGGGIGMMPVGSAILQRNCYCLLVGGLLCYVAAILLCLEELANRALTSRGLVVGLVGVYGLGKLTLFIGRSHPFNLHHCAGPFCILLIYFLARIHESLMMGLTASSSKVQDVLTHATVALVPVGCSLLVLVLVFSHAQAWNYPSLMRFGAGGYVYQPQPGLESQVSMSNGEIQVSAQRMAEADAFRRIAETVKALSEGGKKRIAVISDADTAILVEADLKPWSRFSPILSCLLFREQVDELLRRLQSDPPDYVVLPEVLRPGLEVLGDVHRRILAAVSQQFKVDRHVENMTVFKR